MPETAAAVREISFGDAIREALAEEMRRDSRIVLLGEDVFYQWRDKGASMQELFHFARLRPVEELGQQRLDL